MSKLRLNEPFKNRSIVLKRIIMNHLKHTNDECLSFVYLSSGREGRYMMKCQQLNSSRKQLIWKILNEKVTNHLPLKMKSDLTKTNFFSSSSSVSPNRMLKHSIGNFMGALYSLYVSMCLFIQRLRKREIECVYLTLQM